MIFDVDGDSNISDFIKLEMVAISFHNEDLAINLPSMHA